MAFDKIPKTRRTKTFAKHEDEVDSSAFRLNPIKTSSNIARYPSVSLEFPEIDRDSGDGVASEAVPDHFIIKSVEEKYTLRQFGDTQVENEALSGQCVAKPDDVHIPAKVSQTKEEEKPYSYTYCEMFWSLVAIGSYIVDIGSDVFMGYMYFGNDWWWFGLTIGFTLVSSLTITVVSLTFYRQDQLENKEVKTSRAEWIYRIVLHILQLGPVVRYADTIRYGLKSRRAEKSKSGNERDWRVEKAFEDTDATLLRLLECYLEAAPQLTLQLYIVMVHGFSKTIYFAVGQVVSCVSSLTSIAWALTSYHAALRYSLSHKSNMNNGAIIVMFIWRLCSVTARVLAFALFASHFRWWITVVIGFHVATVFLWVQCQQTAYCRSQATEVLFRVIMALLNTFDFFNLIEGHTRLRYLLFYILIFTENLAMTLTLFLVTPLITPTFDIYPVMASILALHLIAIAIQVTYYLRCHPNNSWNGGSNRIQRCISCFELLSECCPRPKQRDEKINENGDS